MCVNVPTDVMTRGDRITSSQPIEKEHNDKRKGKVKKIKDYPLVENEASDMQESHDLL